jgi:ATP-dependent RNA helicase RhlE
LTHLLNKNQGSSVLIFSRTKHGADKIVKLLKKEKIDSAAIHGNKSQNARQLALGNFKNGHSNVLVATDIAARGIDIEDLQLVVNYDLPNIPETYVHRIGRTGRAGAGGTAVSFCDGEEKSYLHDIQRLIGKSIPVLEHPFMDPGELKVRGNGKKQEVEVVNNNAQKPGSALRSKGQSVTFSGIKGKGSIPANLPGRLEYTRTESPESRESSKRIIHLRRN